MKKIVSLVCVIVLLLSLNVCVFAETEGSEEKIISSSSNLDNLRSYVDKDGFTHYTYYTSYYYDYLKKVCYTRFNLTIKDGHVLAYSCDPSSTRPAGFYRYSKNPNYYFDKEFEYLDDLNNFFNSLKSSPASTPVTTQLDSLASTKQTVTAIPSNITNIAKTYENGNHVNYRFYDTSTKSWIEIAVIDGHVKSYGKSTARKDGQYAITPTYALSGNLDYKVPYFKEFELLFATTYSSTKDSKNTSISAMAAKTDDKIINSNTISWVEIQKGLIMQLSPEWFEVETDEYDALYTHSSNSKYTAIVLSNLEEYKSSNSIDDIFYNYVDKGYQDKLVKININGVPALAVVQEDTYIVVLQKSNSSFVQIRFMNFDENDTAYLNYIEQMVKTISISN